MDPQVLGRDVGIGVLGWSVVRTMASAAMPKSGERRKLLAPLMGELGHQLVEQGQETQTTWEKGGGKPFGGKVQHGDLGRKQHIATAAMVEGQITRGDWKPGIHLSGKGGWQPWSLRGGDTGVRSTQVYQPEIVGGQKTGKGGSGTKRVPEPSEQNGKGRVPKEHAGGVKDARGSQPNSNKAKKLNWDGIARAVASKDWRRKAVSNLRGKMFAKSTLASKASKRRRLCEILTKVKGDGQFFPLETEELELVGAILSECNLKTGEQYINEVKLMQLEAGWAWDEVLERQLAMIKRALRRDVGPDRRAIEVKPEEITVEDPSVVAKIGKNAPAFPKMAYVFAAVWMLRSGEVVALDNANLDLDLDNKKVSLSVQKSKMDQGRKGIKRTLVCCGVKPCRSTCPWRISVKVKTYMAGEGDREPLIADGSGDRVSRYQLVKAWAANIDHGMSGHSARRSGAMFYTREKWSLADLMLLGRWKSAAVFRYMEEAMAELPINDPVRQGNHGAQQAAQDAPTGEGEPPVVRGLEIKSQNASKKPLWAISISSRGKVAHRVRKASWGLAVSEWSTMCGWHFAKNNARVELTRFKELHISCCQKCKSLHALRDGVKGGIELAQLVEI